VGEYSDANGNHGFLWDGSTYTILDVPGATHTGANCISGGNVAGNYSDAAREFIGFFWDGSTYTTIDPPGSTRTTVTDISGGNVVGSYTDASGNHGFLWDGSTYTTLDVPGATSTAANCVSGGNVAGYYRDASNSRRGFYWDGSTYTSIDPPGALSNIYVYGISGRNVVGTYNGVRGFYATPSSGVIPEPLTMIGMALGLGSIGCYIRRRR